MSLKVNASSFLHNRPKLKSIFRALVWMNLLLFFLLGDSLVILWGCLSTWNCWLLSQSPEAVVTGAVTSQHENELAGFRGQSCPGLVTLPFLDSFLLNLGKLICYWHLIIAYHKTSDVFVGKPLYFSPCYHFRLVCSFGVYKAFCIYSLQIPRILLRLL
jgi:hypothetical protein